MRGLIGVALLTGRTVLVPDLACSLPWVEEEPGGSKALPLKVWPSSLPVRRSKLLDIASCRCKMRCNL
jgi:hypothetical protein